MRDISEIDDLYRDDTGRITSDYNPTELEIEVCRQAICREFGNNGTDGYYIRILKAVHAAAQHRHQEIRETLIALVDETCEYAIINHLGDPEKQHNIKRARAALAT